jgi:uncharacterized protein (TIGR02186 family)
MRLITAFFAFLLMVFPVSAEEVVGGLSRDQVSITANFNGSDILVFGAVKRDAPLNTETPLHVIITVSGPDGTVTVRRKDRRVGIWVNTDTVEVDEAPSFYAVATSGPLADVLTETDDLRHEITIPKAIRIVGAADADSDIDEFTEALIRIRTKSNLYQTLENTVNLFEETLFSTTIDLPANLVEGDYETTIFLTRNGRVLDEHTTILQVKKVGLERWIYNLAHQKPLIYGLLSLFIAITAGWAASAVFKLLRF